jgi:hypothetical protein
VETQVSNLGEVDQIPALCEEAGRKDAKDAAEKEDGRIPALPCLRPLLDHLDLFTTHADQAVVASQVLMGRGVAYGRPPTQTSRHVVAKIPVERLIMLGDVVISR